MNRLIVLVWWEESRVLPWPFNFFISYYETTNCCIQKHVCVFLQLRLIKNIRRHYWWLLQIAFECFLESIAFKYLQIKAKHNLGKRRRSVKMRNSSTNRFVRWMKVQVQMCVVTESWWQFLPWMLVFIQNISVNLFRCLLLHTYFHFIRCSFHLFLFISIFVWYGGAVGI